jgi:hypothetical protein
MVKPAALLVLAVLPVFAGTLNADVGVEKILAWSPSLILWGCQEWAHGR